MGIHYKLYAKHFAVLLTVFVMGYILIDKIVSESEVFNFSPNEKQKTEWVQKEDRRAVRNIAKMNQNYDLFMDLGSYVSSTKNWEEAAEYYYEAKVLFPERIEPRKNLCYSYFMMCREDSRLCNRAKRELYYALQYVDETDDLSANYLYHLAELSELEEIVELDEGDAMAAIFGYWE